MKAKRPATGFTHILLPTDGTRLSERAARDAIDLARLSHAKLTALHVIAPFQPPYYSEGYVSQAQLYSSTEYDRMARMEAKRLLAKVAAQARAAKVDCEAVTVEGRMPWKAIVETARKRDCDLIMMASHGRSGVEALIMGSETRKVLAHTRKPVLVCR